MELDLARAITRTLTAPASEVVNPTNAKRDPRRRVEDARDAPITRFSHESARDSGRAFGAARETPSVRFANVDGRGALVIGDRFHDVAYATDEALPADPMALPQHYWTAISVVTAMLADRPGRPLSPALLRSPVLAPRSIFGLVATPPSTATRTNGSGHAHQAVRLENVEKVGGQLQLADAPLQSDPVSGQGGGLL